MGGDERRQHPTGVQPYGNQLLGGGQCCRARMGLLSRCDDQTVLRILSSLPARSLLQVSTACRALYCFANHEELWRALLLEEFEGNFSFQGTWRFSYLSKIAKPSTAEATQPKPVLQVFDFYSDLLFQPFHCASVPLNKKWTSISNIPRRAALSLQEFREQYELPNQPVIITDIVPTWPAMTKWSKEHFRISFAEQQVQVGDYDMKYEDFLQYLRQNSDDMPLYLFDKDFAWKAPALAEEYQVPKYFAEDLFSVLGCDGRPDHKWLIMGSKRSGSSFHKDPNSTSAWNAVIKGSKKWILYPPNVTPPGVVASEDGADVATPVSLIEWFLDFYEETQSGRIKPRECIVQAGELLFVPRGWWHMALNLEECIAVTQNYVSSANLRHVLKVLATESEELISGCPIDQRKTLHLRFLDALKGMHPQLLVGCQGQPSSGVREQVTGYFQKGSDSFGASKLFSFNF